MEHNSPTHMQSETRIDTHVKLVMLQNILTYIRKSLLTRRFSHCPILLKNFSVRRAKVTLGRLKQNSC